MRIIFNCLFAVHFLIIFTLMADQWGPEKCNTTDTVVDGSDTNLTKYICKKNGRKEILHQRNGKYNGLYTAWTSNGKKIEEFRYFDDEFDGEIKGWDTSGFLIVHRFFIKGRPVGFHQEFYSKENPKSKIHYNDQGKKNGLEESWHEDGTRKDSIVNDNGNITEIRAYFNSGKVRYWIKKMDPNSGKKETGVFYDPKGKICGEIKKGNGTYILWSEDTKERWIETYKDGEEVSSRKLADGENPSWT
jgi:antitoxin component YwqK of YwqJK toxin-antitoxin module